MGNGYFLKRAGRIDFEFGRIDSANGRIGLEFGRIETQIRRIGLEFGRIETQNGRIGKKQVKTYSLAMWNFTKNGS